MNDEHNETLKQVMFHLPLYRQVFLADVRDLFHAYPDLKQSHIRAMMFLMFSGEITMTRLARLLRLEKGSMTAVAERLLSAGLAERQTDPADRRKSVLRLTEKGRSLAEAHRAAHVAQVGQRLDRLSEADQAAFVHCLAQMNDLLRRMLAPGELACLNPHASDPPASDPHTSDPPASDPPASDSHASCPAGATAPPDAEN